MFTTHDLFLARVGAAHLPVCLELELDHGGVPGLLVLAAAVHHVHILAAARSEDVLGVAVGDIGLIHDLKSKH